MNDREKWRERESGISVLAARHDDDSNWTMNNSESEEIDEKFILFINRKSSNARQLKNTVTS